MAKSTEFDPTILALLDGYVHGKRGRRDFPERADLAWKRSGDFSSHHLEPAV